MTHAAYPLRRLAPWLALACALAASVSPAWSADNASAQALKALLGPQAAFQQHGGLPPTAAHSNGVSAVGSTSAVVAAAPANAPSGTVTVQRGETLDRLIRRALPDVPLHPDFLRKAFVSLNPQVFPSGLPNQMRSGATLQVPSLIALRQMMLSQHPGSAALLQGNEVQITEGAASQHDPKDQRHWVRFP
jgi:Tfp pilus assembly protein FimV